MKKQYYFIAPLLFLLLSCSSQTTGESQSFVSSTEESNTQESESIPDSSSSLTQEEQEDRDLVTFRKAMKAKEGKVNQKTTDSVITGYYLTNAEPLTIKTGNTSVTTRYGSGQYGPVTDTIGTTGILDEDSGTIQDPESYQIQIYHDDSYFYKITDYEEGVHDVAKVDYDHNFEEKNLSISYTNEVIQDIDSMRDMVKEETYVLDYGGITDEVENGVWSFHYQFTHYDTDLFTILQVIRFENEITVKDNLITKAKIHYENDLYAGNIKTNWVIAESTTEYQQGDYPIFEGDYLNHD